MREVRLGDGDGRKQRRHRVLKGARIVFNGGFSTIDCLVRDLSDTGAKIRVESPIGVPDRFELVLSDGRTWHCRVRWRDLTEFGAEFLS